VSLSQVSEALSYYYDNLDEIRQFETENAETVERVRESSLKPNATT
jgi:transcription-repair coupling factor (superfamily II helicase)